MIVLYETVDVEVADTGLFFGNALLLVPCGYIAQVAVAVLVLQINLQVGNLYDKTKSVVLGVVAGFILSEEGECPHLAIFLR